MTARPLRVVPGAAPGRRPTLTISEAAAACGVSRDVIKRRRRDGHFPHARLATVDGIETWTIPVDDLLAAGFHPNAPERAQESPAVASGDHPRLDELQALRDQLAAAQRQLAEWRARAEERDRTIGAYELAMRALPPAGGTSSSRRWWRRG